MKNLCYLKGKEFLDAHPDSKRSFERLVEECPHLSAREIVMIYHLEDEDVVRAAAHRLEYNATHRGPFPAPFQGADLGVQ